MTNETIKTIWTLTLGEILDCKKKYQSHLISVHEYSDKRKKLEDGYISAFDHYFRIGLIEFKEYAYALDLMIYENY